MQQPNMLNGLMKLQAAANNVTIHHAALSKAIGDFISFLGSDEDFNEHHKYRSAINKQLQNCSDSLEHFCDIVNTFGEDK